MANKTLSIFIDESGDFGKCQYHDENYVVGLVFHDQNDDITEHIVNFKNHLKMLNQTEHAVHTAPLIRRESHYKNDLREDRIKLFSSLFNCARKLPIFYSHILVRKREWSDAIKLTSRISTKLGILIHEHYDFFHQFENIIIYYDNGQSNLKRIITSGFCSQFSHVDVRKVQPVDYLLFQIADLVCTMESLADKLETKSFTKSELDFFKTHRDYKKNYLKWLRLKHL